MNGTPRHQRHPWDSALGHRAILNDDQRAEICERYLAAHADNPKLTKTQFATEAAGEYGVKAGTIRHLLNGVS